MDARKAYRLKSMQVAPAVKRDDVVLSRDQTLQYLRNFTGCDGCGMEKRLQDGRWLHFHTDDELCAEEDVLSFTHVLLKVA